MSFNINGGNMIKLMTNKTVYYQNDNVTTYEIEPIITIGFVQNTKKIDLRYCKFGNNRIILNNNDKTICDIDEFMKYVPDKFYKKYVGALCSCYIKSNLSQLNDKKVNCV